ncbi:MAG: CocE/NonD family hydrolase, partial [Gammaproteobacteria bacterium]
VQAVATIRTTGRVCNFVAHRSDCLTGLRWRGHRTRCFNELPDRRGSQGARGVTEAGTVYRFTIKPFGTANVFKKGHRIRVDISSSNFPRFDVNPNTVEPLGLNRRMVPADNTIHHQAAHPSWIVLPIIPPTRKGA